MVMETEPTVDKEPIEAAEESPSELSSEDESDIEVDEALPDVATNNFEFFIM